jgi:hypothetical protein
MFFEVKKFNLPGTTYLIHRAYLFLVCFNLPFDLSFNLPFNLSFHLPKYPILGMGVALLLRLPYLHLAPETPVPHPGVPPSDCRRRGLGRVCTLPRVSKT